VKVNNKYFISIILAIALLIVSYRAFFHQDKPVPLTEDEKKGMHLLEVAKQACLSGKTDKASVDLNAKLEDKTALSVGANANGTSLSGALNYLDDNIKATQDNEIRECFKPYMETIRQCVIGKCPLIVDDRAPRTIEFQFTYKPKIPLYIKEREVFFGVQYSTGSRLLVLQHNGYFIENVEFPNSGEPIVAEIAPVTTDGNKNSGNIISFALERSAVADYTKNKFTQYDCVADEGCKHNKMSPLWFDWKSQNEPKVSSVWFIPSAYADSEKDFWSIPNLETLNNKNSERTIGYTHFSVTSDKPLNIDADAFFYDITANGVAANINGVTGSYRAIKYDPSLPLNIEFGLQNLNFSGHDAGCDAIGLSIRFIKNGTLLDKPIHLTRPYIALRDAGKVTSSINDVAISWTGNYIRAGKEYDNEVFLLSKLVSNDLDFEAHKTKIQAAVTEIERVKNDFNNLKLTFNNQPLVAVVRPPLTKISYSLAVGIVEDNKQIRFTFDENKARELKRFLIAQRNSSSTAKRVIDPGLFIYKIRGDASYVPSPQACFGREVNNT
jgi:hypothetical protein